MLFRGNSEEYTDHNKLPTLTSGSIARTRRHSKKRGIKILVNKEKHII
jgi:hypothetical protein